MAKRYWSYIIFLLIIKEYESRWYVSPLSESIRYSRVISIRSLASNWLIEYNINLGVRYLDAKYPNVSVYGRVNFGTDYSNDILSHLSGIICWNLGKIEIKNLIGEEKHHKNTKLWFKMILKVWIDNWLNAAINLSLYNKNTNKWSSPNFVIIIRFFVFREQNRVISIH